jgi:PncC family amidohydrolase
LEKPLEVLVGELLTEHGLKLAAAESCTGGLIGHLLTNVAGSSRYYMGSVTAYANEAKEHLLGVRLETLEKFGAVSSETVIEMASGVRKVLEADIGISVSGIAGPGGGTPEKPVGTVWIGLSTAQEEFSRHYLWTGDRLLVKEKTAQATLKILVDYLLKENGLPNSHDQNAFLEGNQKNTMEPIEVTARFDEPGTITPLHITRKGSLQRVESTGRRWSDEIGQHFLVMVMNGQIYELIYKSGEGHWFIRQGEPGHTYI